MTTNGAAAPKARETPSDGVHAVLWCVMDSLTSRTSLSVRPHARFHPHCVTSHASMISSPCLSLCAPCSAEGSELQLPFQSCLKIEKFGDLILKATGPQMWYVLHSTQAPHA